MYGPTWYIVSSAGTGGDDGTTLLVTAVVVRGSASNVAVAATVSVLLLSVLGELGNESASPDEVCLASRTATSRSVRIAAKLVVDMLGVVAVVVDEETAGPAPPSSTGHSDHVRRLASQNTSISNLWNPVAIRFEKHLAAAASS